MNDRKVNCHQMLTRVRDFGEKRMEFFLPSSFGAERFTVIGNVVNELSGYSQTQIAGAKALRQGTATKAELREDVREDLAALIRTARSAARQIPDIDEKFRMPRSNNDQILIDTAKVLAAEAVQFVEELARRELPVDFLEQFGKKIARFEKAISNQNKGTDARVGATAAINSAIERGLEAARDLDAVIRNKFRDDPDALAAWTTARHIERAPKPAVKKETPAVANN